MAEETQVAAGDEIILIEDEPAEQADQTQEVVERAAGGDARTGHAEAVDGDKGGVEPGKQLTLTEAETTARQRRRQRERERITQERQELVVLRRENEALKNNLVKVDTRVSHIEVSAIDNQMAILEQEISRAGTVMARAMEAKNGEDWQVAQDIRDKFRDRLVSLREQKKVLATRPKPEEVAAETPAASQVVARSGDGKSFTRAQVEYAKIFVTRHPWYKPESNDESTQEVMRIDQEMANEPGMDPSTPEYWWELEKRVAEEMPQHAAPIVATPPKVPADKGAARPKGPKLPGSGGGGNGANGAGPKTFHLSAARKQALVDLGVWDDPTARMKHVKRMMQWDKDNAVAEASRNN